MTPLPISLRNARPKVPSHQLRLLLRPTEAMLRSLAIDAANIGAAPELSFKFYHPLLNAL